jgi:hypothetical protein
MAPTETPEHVRIWFQAAVQDLRVGAIRNGRDLQKLISEAAGRYTFALKKERISRNRK